MPPQDKPLLFNRQTVINVGFLLVFLLYIGLLVLLLLSELGVFDWLRATNQVLILLALLFFPFLLLALTKAISSFTLKLPGQEIQVELYDRVKDIESEVKRVEGSVSSQISTAEQALLPILAGDDATSSGRRKQKRLILGAKLDDSHIVFAHVMAAWLEHAVPGLHCELRVPNGGSLKNFADIKHQWIDLYVDFTGTCCQFFNLDYQGKSVTEIIELLNLYGRGLNIRWLAPLGCTEDYCIVINRATAERFGIQTLEDLRWVSHELVFSGDLEFLNRRDCFLGMVNTYQLKFRRTEPCDIANRYGLIDSGDADLCVGYETDPELKRQELMVLKDADGFFPRYFAVPVVSTEALAAIDGLETALHRLQNAISTEDLMTCVLKVRNRGRDPAIARAIAQDFLREKHLLPPARR
jgi:glycine betaine/choline ABC-type transport system substrate-binding protein